MTRLLRLSAVSVALLALTLDAQAARVARFWLEHTISRKAHGPIVNQPGYRFQIGTDGYIVLASKEGQVLFSTYPETQYLGPYDLEQDRIVDLGAQAYTIIRIDSVEQQEIPAHIAANVPAIPASPATPPAEPAVIPAEPWTWDTSAWPLTAMVWGEPFRRIKYDWTLGGYEGERASDLESLRLGATLFWGGWSISVGAVAGGEQVDSVIPPNFSVSDLRLDGGSGLLAALGYMHRIRLDPRWSALVGGVALYRDESYDLTATTLVRVIEVPVVDTPVTDPTDEAPTEPVPEPEPELNSEYATTTSDASLTEYTVTFSGGIEYEADAWGTRLEILLTALEDTSVDARVTVLDSEYLLEGSRSHPVSVALTGWCYVLEGVRLESQLSAGAETAIRLGAAYEW